MKSPTRHGKAAAVAASAALVSRLLVRGIGLVLLIVIARRETPQFFASYSYLLVLASIFGSLSDVGVAGVAGREVARGDLSAADAYHAGMPVLLTTAGLAAAAVVGIGVVSPGPNTSLTATFAAAAFTLVTELLDFACELLRAVRKPFAEGTIQVVGSVLTVVLGTIVLFAGGTLADLLLVLTAKQVAMYLATHFWLPAPWHGHAGRAVRRTFLRQGAVLGLASTCTALLWRLPQIVLGNAAPARQVADYALASRFIELGRTLCSTLGFSVLPSLAARSSKQERPVEDRKVLLLAFAGAWVLVVPAVLLTPLMLPAVFGHEYARAAGLTQLLLLAMPFTLVFYIAWFMLIATRRERSVLRASVVGVGMVLLGVPVILLWPSAETTALVTDASAVVTSLALARAATRHSGTGAAVQDPLPLPATAEVRD